MSRVKIKFPADNPLFTASIPVRVGDLNYANHVGNDSVLSVIHEARMQWLRCQGYDEMNAGGNSLIMADVMIAYKGESFYGDTLLVRIYADEITDRSFDLLYQISTVRNGMRCDIADAKTGMVCFDYESRKIVSIQSGLKRALFIAQ
jgi:acyl-CoA thioester hydrolase